MRLEACRRFLIITATAAAAVALAYLSLRYIVWWVLPFLIAFAVAAMLEPVIVFLQRRFRFRRTFSAATLTLFLLFLLGGIFSLLLTTLLSEANGFLAQSPALLAALPEYLERFLTRFERYCADCPAWLQDYLAAQLTDFTARSSRALDALLTRLLALLGSFASAVPRLVLIFATTVLAIYFTAASYPTLCAAARSRFSLDDRRRIRLLRSGMAQSVSRWLRAQAMLCLVTFLQLLVGFFLMRERYVLLTAFLITLVDALPVFGTGTVLIPWALFSLLLGNTPHAIALTALYLTTLLVRNILEPKLMAAQAGLPPIASLGAMYLGFCTFGVTGMILFPFLLLLFSQLWSAKKEGSN